MRQLWKSILDMSKFEIFLKWKLKISADNGCKNKYKMIKERYKNVYCF